MNEVRFLTSLPLLPLSLLLLERGRSRGLQHLLWRILRRRCFPSRRGSWTRHPQQQLHHRSWKRRLWNQCLLKSRLLSSSSGSEHVRFGSALEGATFSGGCPPQQRAAQTSHHRREGCSSFPRTLSLASASSGQVVLYRRRAEQQPAALAGGVRSVPPVRVFFI